MTVLSFSPFMFFFACFFLSLFFSLSSSPLLLLRLYQTSSPPSPSPLFSPVPRPLPLILLCLLSSPLYQLLLSPLLPLCVHFSLPFLPRNNFAISCIFFIFFTLKSPLKIGHQFSLQGIAISCIHGYICSLFTLNLPPKIGRHFSEKELKISEILSYYVHIYFIHEYTQIIFPRGSNIANTYITTHT